MPDFKAPRDLTIRAMTLLELLAVLVILLVLAAIAVPAYHAYAKKMEMPRCMANLRTLHTALNSHLVDKKRWVKVIGVVEVDTDEESMLWMRELAPYGMSEKSWKCPTVLRMTRGVESPDVPMIHYKPTLFDQNELTPRRWPKMPWALEIGNMHGSGILMLFGDGSIQPSLESK